MSQTDTKVNYYSLYDAYTKGLGFVAKNTINYI